MKTNKLLITVVLIVISGAVSCDDDGHVVICPVCRDNPSVSNLDVDIIDGYIYANLMPPVIPDPVNCRLTLTVENESRNNSFSGITIPSAFVYLSDSNRPLGEIFFETDWDGIVRPGAMDTVLVTKILEDEPIFTTPCLDDVYLRVIVSCPGCDKMYIRSRDYTMECVH